MNNNLYSHISDIVFDDTQVHELYLTFTQGDFWEQMLENYNNGLNEYIPATFEFNSEVYDSVGVRFKGNASMVSYPSNKKPFKIKFDEYVEDQEFYGISKLSLSNGFSDPSFLREKMMFDALNQFIPSSRANFIKLFINGDYWGLYTNVEQLDQKFIEKNFGNDECGNLFKGDPSGSLEWLGEDPEQYYLHYELKTNEEINDWSDLIHFIDILNNTTIEELQDSLETVFHSHNFLFFNALNNFFVNLDSYICKGHNYYVYHRTDTDKFVHLPWDLNLSFGNYSMGMTPPELLNLSIYWTFDLLPRPLVERMFEIPDYCEIYEMDYQYIMDNVIIEEELFARVDTLADLIRPAVYADSLKMYSNEDFEININDDLIFGNVTIFGIKSYITARRASIIDQLEEFNIRDRTTGLFINEFMADNETIICDEFDEYDDWVEIYNSNPGAVNMDGLFLTDDPMIPDKWQFPEVEIPANGFLLVWTDDDEEQGALHTNFRLDADGEFIGLYEIDGIIPIDTLSYGPQEEDISFGRYPDGVDNWVFMINPTPEAPNIFTSADENNISQACYNLIGNYPNPFNPTTTIKFALKEVSDVSIKIYNIKGAVVRTLVDGEMNAKYHEVIWDGKDNTGKQVGSGLYFYKMVSEGNSGRYTSTKKMVLLK
jgi:spore coat protein CotH